VGRDRRRPIATPAEARRLDVGSLISLLKGWPGKPSHPPLTDASIGAYTVGLAMLVAGALGLEEEQMAHGALLAIGGGLALAGPTALTGLLDWLGMEKGTPWRRTATIHLVVMLSATALFALTFIAQLDGYDDGSIEAVPLVLGLAALVTLATGGWIGGTMVYVYGVRVLKRENLPVSDALIPGRTPPEEGPPPSAPAGNRP
jgi:uncharacterized membrane protein